MTDNGGLPMGRVAVLATGYQAEADSAVRRLEIDPVVVLGKDAIRRPLLYRSLLRAAAIDTLALHARSWERVPNPHLFMVAAAAAPVSNRILVTDGGVHHLSRATAALWAPRLGLDALIGAGPLTATAVARLARPRVRGRKLGRGDRVIAIWRGAAENTVGGSVTHISGILSGFRALGLSTALVSAVPPPDQLAGLIDDAEIVAPLPSSLRVTRDVEGLALDRRLFAAAHAMHHRSSSLFFYQRHNAFLTCGVDAATACRIPLVLEWNASELWTRQNWQSQRPLNRLFNRLVEMAEHRSAVGADIVAAVSGPAADMATAAGAPPTRILVSPNAVDVELIDRIVAGLTPRKGVIGWIGSFGPWHGAPILVRAFARLPASAKLVLIGDGQERDRCRKIARDLGVDQRIEWCGVLPHGEALRRLASCSLLASPHVPLPGRAFFGSPTKLFEYMALQRPIVASSLDQIADVLKDGVTAKLVPAADEGALAAGLAELLQDPGLGRTLAANARREVEVRHTWVRRAEEIVGSLERMCSTAPNKLK